MSSSRLRSRDRQQLRAEVYASVGELPIPYVLEAVAQQLEVRSGTFEVTLRDGFLSEVIRKNRFFEVRWGTGEVFEQFGHEKFFPSGLWERPPQVSKRIVSPYHRTWAV
jgi:hypothetical protein